MDANLKIAWKDYLLQFISDERKQRFHEVVEDRTRHLTVVLEDIYQPQNASAVLRTCDLCGIQDVHIIESKNTYTLNPQVALGSSKWINMYKYNKEENNTEAAFKALRDNGYRIVATSPHKDDVLLDELPLDQKTALVFGTELQGLSDYALSHADAWVKIPMLGFTESYNISVSAALSLYTLSQKLRKTNINWALSDEEKIEVLTNWGISSVKRIDLHEQNFLNNIAARK